MEHYNTQLDATDVVLEPAVLDRIDEIVPPGTVFNRVDLGYTPPSLEPAALRRR